MKPVETKRRFLVIWWPDWPIQRRVVERPELRGRAVVVFTRDAHGVRRVVACSPLARRRGVEAGRPMSDVESLIARTAGTIANSTPAATSHAAPPALSRTRRESSGANRDGANRDGVNPDRASNSHEAAETCWVLETHDPLADRTALEHLADRCHWFSPQVGLEPGEEPDGLRLEINRAARWFGSEQRLVDQLLSWLVHAGYWPRIAVADTLGMAWGWARFIRMACGKLPVDDATESLVPW
ncbi:MAG: hypothetical protein R3B96_19215, partial [Pirellulaceae bacterium]